MTDSSVSVTYVIGSCQQRHRPMLFRVDVSVREPSEGLILTNRHRQERLGWCRARLCWRLNNEWSHVLFLDESWFNLSHSDGRARIYRRENERYADCCVQEMDGGSVMVWAGITSRRTNLVFVDGTLTAARYRDNILAVEVVNFLNHNGPGITFQQDNARPHTARITQAFLQQQNIDVLPWPSKSPDLNPIEHIWNELDHRVWQRPHKPITLPELRQALQEEWDNLPQAVISTVIASLRCCCWCRWRTHTILNISCFFGLLLKCENLISEFVIPCFRPLCFHWMPYKHLMCYWSDSYSFFTMRHLQYSKECQIIFLIKYTIKKNY